MVSKIKAKGFKGQSFEQALAQNNLIVGPNGSGKSARSQALILALNGYLPEIGKRNQDIFDALASDTELIVEITIGNKRFERMFYRTKKGASQSYRLNGSKVGKDEFIQALAQAGAPKALDLEAFLNLSDAKQIDWLFKLFPPEGNVSDLDRQVEQAQKKLNKAVEDQRSLEKSAQSLHKSRAEMQLPAMTLAEVRERIKTTEDSLHQARADLEQARIEEARAQEREAAAKQQPKPGPTKKQDERKPPFPDVPDPFQGFEEAQAAKRRYTEPTISEERTYPDPAESIKAIMQAIDRAGCSACAAKLVCKRELKKFKEAVPA